MATSGTTAFDLSIDDIIQEGYQIDDKLLRPARVVVAKKPEIKIEQEEEE